MSEMVVATKECTACERVLSLSEFYIRKDRPNGVHSECKDCERERVKAAKQRMREEMGEEAYLAHQARIVDRHRRRTGNQRGKAYMRARGRAAQALIDAHRSQFERLLAIELRGEEEAA